VGAIGVLVRVGEAVRVAILLGVRLGEAVRVAVRVTVLATLVGVAVFTFVGEEVRVAVLATLVGVRLGFIIGQIKITDLPSVAVLICSFDSHVTVNAESGLRAIVCELDCLGCEAPVLARTFGTAQDTANMVATAVKVVSKCERRIILLLGKTYGQDSRFKHPAPQKQGERSVKLRYVFKPRMRSRTPNNRHPTVLVRKQLANILRTEWNNKKPQPSLVEACLIACLGWADILEVRLQIRLA
jgi:hypothetical protein